MTARDRGELRPGPRFWRWLPVEVRAGLTALVILLVGQAPPGLMLAINMRLAPEQPWFLPLTLVWLALYASWLNGVGWPRVTAAARRADLRASPLPARVWALALAAGGLSMAGVMSLALYIGRVATLPDAAYAAPLDLSPYPWWTMLSVFLALAVTAGVVEEAAFRGCMLSAIQRRRGWLWAIIVTAALFYAVHLSHAYATPAFIPFFAAYSLVQGALVFLTRSILPGVVIHALGDFVILPMQYGVIPLPFGERPEPYLACVVGFSLAGAVALVILALATRPLRRAGER